LRTIRRRLGRLEYRFQTELSGKPKVSLRIPLSSPWKGPANLATSTCRRQLWAGSITEFVEFDGDHAGISEENWRSSSRAFR
jgi:hypothetical protein